MLISCWNDTAQQRHTAKEKVQKQHEKEEEEEVAKEEKNWEEKDRSIGHVLHEACVVSACTYYAKRGTRERKKCQEN